MSAGPLEGIAGVLISARVEKDHALKILKKIRQSHVLASISFPFACSSCQPFTPTAFTLDFPSLGASQRGGRG